MDSLTRPGWLQAAHTTSAGSANTSSVQTRVQIVHFPDELAGELAGEFAAKQFCTGARSLPREHCTRVCSPTNLLPQKTKQF